MNYKEVLFFVARALTINNENHNLEEIENAINSNSVDWDKVVQLSTSHYVFPALYCNLKKAQQLDLLPQELVEYMKHITDLNRERNLQIINQAKELNSLLRENSIEPIFLKGTGFLLQDFYKDLGERMVGDIDFLVSKENYEKAIQILKESGYKKNHETHYSFPQFKHYDKLVKDDSIAAVEIHKEMTIEGYHHDFNFSNVSQNIISKKDCSVLSFENQLCLSIIAKQINDDGQFYHDIALRNAYDVFLLSQKVASLEAIQQYPTLFDPLNNFLTICQYVFQSDKFSFQKTDASDYSVSFFIKKVENLPFGQKHQKKTSLKLATKKRLKFLLQSLTRKENRVWMWNRFRDKDWQRQKLVQLGLIKSKS